MRVVVEDKGVRGGQNEVLESEELAEFARETNFRISWVHFIGMCSTSFGT